ncbi:hypothetical protein NTGHW29_140064 [Candidatus Nitrotoga sp. HW29]|nr:hypothetical protein NTGHW29_140064 [Candidatus Nitrotoga sp. HW29]
MAKVLFSDWDVSSSTLACAKLLKKMAETNIVTSCLIIYSPIEKSAAILNGTVWTAVCVN